MKTKNPIINILETEKGKVCVFTQATTENDRLGQLVALEFQGKRSSERERLVSHFIKVNTIYKLGGIVAIRNRIFREFAKGDVRENTEERFNSAVFGK